MCVLSSRRRHTRCALGTGVQTCALPISGLPYERRRARDEIAQRLAAIVESSDDAILAKDLDGTITSWNRGAERLFGYRAAEIVGKSVMLLLPDDRQIGRAHV